MITQEAKRYAAAGLKVVAIGDKKLPFKKYKWGNTDGLKYIDGASGVGIACGKDSNGIECLDFDNHIGNAEDIADSFITDEVVSQMYLDKKIVIESTPSGGFHIIFQCDYNEGNLKLSNQNNGDKVDCVIETRGEGGYFVCSPTDGYNWINLQDENGKDVVNDICDLTRISKEERSYLIQLAKSYDNVSKVETQPYIAPPKNVNQNVNIIDIYHQDPNSIQEAMGILEGNGWKFRDRRYGKGYELVRPDKNFKDGISATFGYVAENCFYVFTSSAYPFEPNKGYNPFLIKSLLEHNGNHKECAKELYQRYDFEPIKIESTPKDLEKLEAELMLNKLDVEDKIEKPPTILSVREKVATSSVLIPVLSCGDLSLLQGLQKSKKTFFTSSIAVSLLNNDVHNKLHSSMPFGRDRFAFFDTEQSPYYAQKTNRRIYLTSKSSNFDYFALRDKNPTQRRELIEYYLKKNHQCSFIFIDGIVDLLYDFNDLKECTELVQWVMSITKKYNVHCLMILHENIGSGKARGHIGTMLSQKAETVLKIEKDENDTARSTISAKDTRGKGFKDFSIVIDENGTPTFDESALKL